MPGTDHALPLLINTHLCKAAVKRNNIQLFRAEIVRQELKSRSLTFSAPLNIPRSGSQDFTELSQLQVISWQGGDLFPMH